MDSNNPSKVLGKAFLNAGDIMGLTLSELSQIINCDISPPVQLSAVETVWFNCDISQLNQIAPKSNEGTRAIYFIRLYKKLYELLNGDEEEMKLWMKGYNTGTCGIPSQQLQESDTDGLKHVMEYLEALP